MRAECREQVAQALGKKKLSAADSNRISQLYIRAQNILARTDPDWLLKSPAERAEAITQKTASDLSIQIAKNNQNIARDAILKAQLEQEIYNHSTLNPIQVLMRKIAYFSDQSGIQSVEKQAQALHSRWMSLVADVFTKTQERWGFSVNKEMTDDIIRVMFGGKSDNPEITAMAKEVSFALEEMRLAFNRAGGNIRKLDNFGIMTSHDQKKVALSTEQEWVDEVLPKLDRNQYVREDGLLMSDSEVRTMLKDVYRTIATNGANKVLDGRKSISPVGGRSKMANRHQEARALHFKDGDSWLEYQAKFGTYNETGFHEILKNHTHRMSTEIAMMQNFGSNPRLSFENLLEEASTKLKADPENGSKHGEIDKQSKRALSMYNTLDANTRAVDSTLGNVMGGLRALMVASKLGGTTLTTIGDHASTKKTANMLGLSYTKSVLPEYMKQLTQGNYRDEALRFGLGITEMVGSTSRFGDADVVSSATKAGRFNARMQQLASTTLKISGLNAVTAGMKRAFNLVHMNKIAEMTRSTHWKDLGKDDLKILKGNGITEKDWNLWRELTPSKREDGAIVLTQNDFFNAPDEVIKKFLPKDKQDSPTAIVDYRYKAAMKYQTHIFNEESVAVIEAGVRERSIINLGDAGTIQGELGRTLFQFKGFPLAYMLRIGHRAFAQGDIKSRATFLVSLLAYQTLAGAFIVQLQNLANGKNPEPVFTPDFFGKSILKGGGLSFMGDLMSALSDPTGRSFGDFVAGPLVSQGGKLGMLLTGMGNNFIEGKESTRAMEIANTLKGNLPFQNIWYSKLIIDRMLYSKLQNMIDPDYLPKTQKRLENLGNSYWWDLSE
ncbi:hypothetical protein JHZ77_000920 [Acinetobacter baumannii]|uniref:hypothetical protein n=1 Tax=Acinetobacter calcoaceticus/baumannii complex TaxID=909768 RepID=UPI001AE17E15|nr:hypothetical protein [Acinetobacter nosocomialis]EKV6804163.1 hypothetical protein [Acinetobacter baumannii]EKV6848018.1 hypothetical protein [Acinetobacter baumannii]EKW9037577.1 hypothetical protein [Acinetobacter baumannii]EKX2703575.1 hypothetical protein [Acinetobacter baumannii]ELB1471263.1 hypothetical protein [Acinetobacter baumannii]